MLEIIENLPDNVIGMRAIGTVTSQDYTDILIPEVEKRLQRHKRLRMLYELGIEFRSFSAGAAWQDTKVGMQHLTHFERVAVVTDVDWISHAVRMIGFMLPGEVRVWGSDGMRDANAWITEPTPRGSLRYEFDERRGVLKLFPAGELEAAGFDRIAAVVDPFIESHGELPGIIIVAEQFPGWDDFAALAAHLQFIRDHASRIRRVAVVTDSHLLAALPRVAAVFVASEVRHFDFSDQVAANDWVLATARRAHG